MIRFNKSAGFLVKCFSSEKADPSLIINTQYDKNNDARDKIHLAEHSEAEKAFLYEQSRVRRTTSLYNLFSILPYMLFKIVTQLWTKSPSWHPILRWSCNRITCTCPDCHPMECQFMIHWTLPTTCCCWKVSRLWCLFTSWPQPTTQDQLFWVQLCSIWESTE